MTGKRSKLTADKARERITILEESIALREQKLEHLRAKLSRTVQPEDKLLRVEERLAKRLELEHDQLSKLRRLLSRQNQSSLHDSAEYYSNEELDDLHRSFEEVRQDLSQVKLRLENTEVPRDLPSRINAFEERLSRREEADTGVFTQLMSLQSALDQERETVRKLSRRVREQEQSLEALREAVEDSVVATVDLAERLDEMDESIGEQGTIDDTATHAPELDIESIRRELQSGLQEMEDRYLERLHQMMKQSEKSESQEAQLELVLEAIQDFDARLEELEGALACLSKAPAPSLVNEAGKPETTPLHEVDAQFAPTDSATLSPPAESVSTPSEPLELVASVSAGVTENGSAWIPARFAGSESLGRQVAHFAKRTPKRFS